ncbi:MAG: DUF1345 domain-containing protein [Chitinophagaceae bacterium]
MIEKIVQKIDRLDAHHKLYISFAVAIVFFLATTKFSLAIHLMATWLAFGICTLILSWITILSHHPAQMKRIAKKQDSSRTLIFFFVIIAAFVSLFAVIFLLKSTQGLSKSNIQLHILITIASVICSWFLVHTVFTLRYAHLFYNDHSFQEDSEKEIIGGLVFPKEEEPDYLDFVYFSFVIGMTFQVSDVQITSRRIRRLVWMHGILSFAFNTVIVALSINVISGLVQK